MGGGGGMPPDLQTSRDMRVQQTDTLTVVQAKGTIQASASRLVLLPHDHGQVVFCENSVRCETAVRLSFGKSEFSCWSGRMCE